MVHSNGKGSAESSIAAIVKRALSEEIHKCNQVEVFSYGDMVITIENLNSETVRHLNGELTNMQDGGSSRFIRLTGAEIVKRFTFKLLAKTDADKLAEDMMIGSKPINLTINTLSDKSSEKLCVRSAWSNGCTNIFGEVGATSSAGVDLQISNLWDLIEPSPGIEVGENDGPIQPFTANAVIYIQSFTDVR